MKQPAVYILASTCRGTLYVGVTNNLISRVWQHKQGRVEGFTQQYAVHRLVYFEVHDEMYSAITREKQLKRWKRLWKIRMIEGVNPEWRDLYPDLL